MNDERRFRLLVNHPAYYTVMAASDEDAQDELLGALEEGYGPTPEWMPVEIADVEAVDAA